MKISTSLLVAFSLAAASLSISSAQDMQGPPKVLQVTRELLKPGKSGDIHDKSESKFVTAMANAKSPTKYIALGSLSGKSRALYLTGYASFAAWQDDMKSVLKNKALSAELDKDSVADGELLDGLDQSVWTYDPDLSYRPGADLAQVRFFEITDVEIKPGHYKDLQDLVKLIVDTHKKAGDSATWATYDLAYGGGEDFAILTGDKSLADIDTAFTEDAKFREALGSEGLKKLSELEASTVKSVDSQLFYVNPAQSYPTDEWVKAAPDFWKTKPAAPPAAKPAAKPAQ